MDRREQLALGAILLGALVLGLKYAAYLLTGSVALFSDALESVINVITAVVALTTIRISAQPADANHPYGHTKAEYFSAVLEGVLIVVAALLIIRSAIMDLSAPEPIDAPMLGLAVNAVAGLINAAWAWLLIRDGTRLRSAALVADGRHLFTDVVTSAGIIVGLIAATYAGLPILDPLLALSVALNILWSGWRVMRESLGALMDEAAPPETLARIRDIIAASADGAMEAHDLRTRHAGRATFIDFHLVVPGSLPVSEAHAICDRIERSLRSAVEDATVTIHVEPEDKAKHSGIIVL